MRFDDSDGVNHDQELLVVSSRRVGDRAVIELAGELDLHGRGKVISAAQVVLEEPPRPEGLDIDATRLEFIDSSGLSTLLQIRDQASLVAVPFAVTGASPEFHRVVDIAGLSAVLSVSDPPGA